MKAKHLLQAVSAMLLAAAAVTAVPAVQASAAEPVSAPYVNKAAGIVSGADYTIMVRLSGKFVTASEDGNVQQWEATGKASQNWRIIDAGGGYCAFLSSEDPSKAITVESGDSTDGSNFALTEYTGSKAQRFRLNKTDDAFYITAECSGNAAMDVYDISYDNGANIDQWDYWGGEGQKFYIRPAGGKYTFLFGDLDFNGRLDAADLTLLKRGLRDGFDDICAYVAHCSDTVSYTVPMDGKRHKPPVVQDDAEYLRDYLLTKRDKFWSTTVDIPTEEKEPVAYLFAYFLGNAADQERLSYAISTDGYHFKALNGGKAVWQSSVGTKCIRDPYIFKGQDGLWHLLATDMKSSLGWSSNRNLISAASTDSQWR